eukprot:GAHX01001102.1.p1 GENE.GAHX01001102.1~~GAHX01001102.1.p1  ORF type:complete len:395 (-),score=93.12 GAHX01001102.1:28-1212(-)
MSEIQSLDYLHVAARPKSLKTIKDERAVYFMKEYNKRIHESKSLNLSKQHMMAKDLKTLLNDEPVKILFSCEVSKINEHGKSQKRYIVITNFGLYNIKPSGFKIQRVISLEEIYGLTLSLIPAKQKPETEFVVHVCMNYDYRFSSEHSLEIVRAIETLSKTPKYTLFSEINKGTEYEKEKEITLECKKTRYLHNYVVTKSDLSQILKARKKLMAKQKKQKPAKEYKHQVTGGRQTPFGVISYDDEDEAEMAPEISAKENPPVMNRKNKYEEFDDGPYISNSAKQSPKLERTDKTKENKLMENLAEKYGNQPLGGISNLKEMILQAKKKLVKPKKQTFDEASEHEEENNDKTLHNNFEAILERRYANENPLESIDPYNDDEFRVSDIDLSEDELI